jgi:prepilin-type N-terminal cleavage/methylation domain-containing protein
MRRSYTLRDDAARFTLRGAERGYTLLELVIVASIVAVLAAVALPASNPSEVQKLELAATRVAEAIRHARTEALRTGEGHGLTISQSTQQVTVEQYDLTTAPVSAVATLIHPIDKQPYDININTTPSTSGVTISNSQDVFNYKVLGRRQSLIFDANGTPIWVVGSGPTTYLLGDGAVELSYGTQQRLVRIAPITGRVTIE